MKVREIVEYVNGTVLCCEECLDVEIKAAFGSDLMSDVLAYCEEESILITGLVNNQVIRTAEMLDLRAIVFVRGKKPSEDVIELAIENEIALIASHHSMYTAAGILFSKGLNGTKF